MCYRFGFISATDSSIKSILHRQSYGNNAQKGLLHVFWFPVRCMFIDCNFAHFFFHCSISFCECEVNFKRVNDGEKYKQLTTDNQVFLIRCIWLQAFLSMLLLLFKCNVTFQLQRVKVFDKSETIVQSLFYFGSKVLKSAVVATNLSSKLWCDF